MIGITGVFCDLCDKRVLDGHKVHQDCVDREQAQTDQSSFEKVDWVEDIIAEMVMEGR